MARSVHSDAQHRRTASSQRRLADHVEEGVLLAGEGRTRQVLGGGAGAHRHRAAAELAVRGGDLGAQVVGLQMTAAWPATSPGVARPLLA